MNSLPNSRWQPLIFLAQVVPGANTNDIRNIKPPVEIPNPWIWVWWSLAVIVLAALAWWFWRLWKSQKPAPPAEPVMSAHERARQRLRNALALVHDARPFCIALSDAIRLYLEERFHFRAPERTTEEFLDELQHSAKLSLDQKQTLGEFLQRCDLVKFARLEPTEDELRQLYEVALRLVDETCAAETPELSPGEMKSPTVA